MLHGLLRPNLIIGFIVLYLIMGLVEKLFFGGGGEEITFKVTSE